MRPLRQSGTKKLESKSGTKKLESFPGLDEALSSHDMSRDITRTATPGLDHRPPSSLLMAAANEMTGTGTTRRDLESLFEKYYGGLSDHMINIETCTTEAIQRMEKQIAEGNAKVQTVLDMQHNLAEYLAKSNCKDEIQDVLNKHASHDAKLTNMADLQRWMIEVSQDTQNRLRDLSEKAERNDTDLRVYVDSRASCADVEGLQENTSQELDYIRGEMYKSRVQSNFDCKTILGEINRIQKSLQVDYLAVQLTSAFPGDTSRDLLPSQDSFSLLDDASLSLEQKRLRDVAMETELDIEDGWAQTDPVKFEDGKKKEKITVSKPAFTRKNNERRRSSQAFSHADDLRAQARLASMKPPYSVFDYYHQTGLAQHIAKSNLFDRISLFVTCFNAFWIAIDADLNKSQTIADATLAFLIVENFFCLFFLVEIIIWFLAFESKSNCLRDGWFVFDAILSFMMVLETWVLYMVIYALGADPVKGVGATFRLFRFAKLSRITKIARLSKIIRLVRLARSVPELLVVLKAMKFALRSVLVFFLVWGLIIYAFAILLRQLTEDNDIGRKYFPDIPHSMNTLLLRGIFPSNADVLHDITDDHVWLWPFMILFVSLVSLLTMYMLVGVLVDTVKSVASAEKEALTVGLLAGNLREEFQKLGYQPDIMEINRYEFETLITNPSVMNIMQDIGVDVEVLADMLELVCEDLEKTPHGSMTFPAIVDTILSMRGTNSATVKDCKELVRLNKQVLRKTVDELTAYMQAEFASVKEDIAMSGLDLDDVDGLDDQIGDGTVEDMSSPPSPKL